MSRQLRLFLRVIARILWVSLVSYGSYLGWKYLLSPSDQRFALALALNPFVLLAVMLLGVHIANFAYLAHKVNRACNPSPQLSSERVGDWRKIEILYDEQFGLDLRLRFHRLGLKLAFVSFTIGGVFLLYSLG